MLNITTKPSPELSTPGREAMSLLRDYPAISSEEEKRLITLTPNLTRRDIAELASDPQLAGNLHDYYERHHGALTLPLPKFLALLLAFGTTAGLLFVML